MKNILTFLYIIFLIIFGYFGGYFLVRGFFIHNIWLALSGLLLLGIGSFIIYFKNNLNKKHKKYETNR